MGRLSQKRVLLGVGGGIAAYKALALARLLKKEGAEVQALLTRAATHFATPLSFEALTGRPPLIDPLEMRDGRIPHIEEAYAADAAVVAPATANLLARMAGGHADDALTLTLLSLRAPLILAPAMESRMWTHPATQNNARILRERGAHQVGPLPGELASGRSGQGRLAEPEQILETLIAALGPRDLDGRKILITAGPTVEDLDPVRFISNRSTGKMGVALARACAQRGAQVTLIHGPLQVAVPRENGIHAQPVRSASQMAEAVFKCAEDVELCILCAAVADFTPTDPADDKIKKDGRDDLSLKLERTPDILASLGQREDRPYLVGFAAETSDVEARAEEKLRRKGCDLICANSVAGAQSAFGADDNSLSLFFADGHRASLGPVNKATLAHRLLDTIIDRLNW
jgi:phosphopantothenoylcysteine decarboxylase/phosphopantothenate--cysteine ligase